MNPFEAGARKAIPAVLVYIFNGDELLMIHRGAGSSRSAVVDYHLGKWNGLGGKCEADESPLEAARRETLEESGLDIPVDRLEPLGVLQFPNFKPHKSEDWIVFVFRADLAAEVAREAKLEGREIHEGRLHWIRRDAVPSLALWEGDRRFIPWVLAKKPFLGTFWYRDQKLLRHWIVPFGIVPLGGESR